MAKRASVRRLLQAWLELDKSATERFSLLNRAKLRHFTTPVRGKYNQGILPTEVQLVACTTSGASIHRCRPPKPKRPALSCFDALRYTTTLP